jgi:hypothetical protein
MGGANTPGRERRGIGLALDEGLPLKLRNGGATILAWIAEAPERRGIAACVAALNLSGVGVAVMFFALDGADTGRLLRYLAQPSVWVGMYGSAAIGLGLFLSIPPVVQAADLYRRRQRLSELRRFRRQLLDEWGEEVAGRPGTDSAGDEADSF